MKQPMKEWLGSVMESSGVKFVGSIYGKSKQGYDGSTYRVDGVCPTLLTNSITNNKMYILVAEDEEEIYLDIIINDRGFTNKEPQITYGICPTLRREAHGNLPKVIIIEEDKNGILRME